MNIRSLLKRARDRSTSRQACTHVMSRAREDWMGATYLICEKCGYEELSLDTD